MGPKMKYNSRMKKSLTIVPILVAIPVLLALFLQVSTLASIRNLLPFGYAYQVSSGGKLVRGHLPDISIEQTRALLPAGKSGEIRLAAKVWSSSTQPAHVHLSPLPFSTLILNGEAVMLQPSAVLHPVLLTRGWNDLIIFYRPGQAARSRGCKFFFRVPGWTDPFIHQRTVPPGQPLVTVLSYFFRILGSVQTPLVLLALLLLLGAMIPLFRQPSAEPPAADVKKSGFLMIFRILLRFASLFAIIFHLTGRLRFFIYFLLGIGWFALFLMGLFRRSRPKTSLHWRPDWPVLLVFALALILTSSFVFFISGSFFPLEPPGGVDLLNHLSMIKHIERTGETTPEEYWHIYPQGSHGLLVATARLLGRSPEEILTPVSIFLFAGILLLLYLLSRSLFETASPGWFIGSFVLIYFPTLLNSLFVWSSFPAFFSFFFFFSAMLFLLSGDRLDSALALSAATAIYPLFAGIYIIVFFLILTIPGAKSLRQFFRLGIRPILFLLPAIVITLIYFKEYTSTGMVSAHLKSHDFQTLNPFDALEPVGVFLFVCGFCFFVQHKKKIPTLIAAGLIGGFLLYYIPFRVNNLFGFYFVVKIVFFLFFWTVIFGAYALHQILRSKHLSAFLKTCLLLSLLTLAGLTDRDFLVGLQHQLREHRVSINQSGRIYRGMIPVCRWISAAFPAGKPIHLVSVNPHLQALIEVILGKPYPISRQPPGEIRAEENSLLVIERDSTPPGGIPPSWRKIHSYHDFTVYGGGGGRGCSGTSNVL